MQPYFLKLSRIKNVQVLPISSYHVISEMIKKKSTNLDDILDPRVRELKHKLLYSDYIERRGIRKGYYKNIEIKKKLLYKFEKEKLATERNSPETSIALKYLDNEGIDVSSQSEMNNCIRKDIEIEDGEEEMSSFQEKPIHMPYATVDKFEVKPTNSFEHKDKITQLNAKYKVLYEKYLALSKHKLNSNDTGKPYKDEELLMRLDDDLSKVPTSWMTDYEIYNDVMQEDYGHITYGTPNPDVNVSSVPCGGCGALLQCNDVAIPGYLPSELFVNKSDEDLKSVTCQRCHFMKVYNTCLDVRVSADEYPKLLEQIKYNKKAMVILLVDLTDFPCSIWPDLPSLIGEFRHVFVVGNKIDLLPKDSPHFFTHVKDCLTESLIQTGISQTNIKHIGLISAKTGFGVEQLINKLHKLWNYRSDIYLVGCTNAGKSTLFNTFLHSDLCKSQAVDIVQRATTSPWPGTTLNLLKFPILRPSGIRLYQRTQRLKEEMLNAHSETELRRQEMKESRNIQFATLQSRIVHTFKKEHELKAAFWKANESETVVIDKPQKFGLDENSPEYQNSRWCYDTPGTIQPDQILHLLTTDELLKTLPDRIISPRTFCIRSGQTIFIAGLGRLDILDVPTVMRCTVFASMKLPITICKVEDAEHIYDELIQTEAFAVPINDPNRLKMWPEMKSKDLETVGVGELESVSDVVLSSAGWIAITAKEDETVLMRAWTPEGRGIYFRTPSLLPKSVTLRGMRRVGNPAYRLGRQVSY